MILVEGFAGGGIKSKRLPCEPTSSPAQNHEKNNALWLTRSCFRLNMFRSTILVSLVLFATQQCAQNKTSMLKLLLVCVEGNPITERRRAEHFAKKDNSRMTINNRTQEVLPQTGTFYGTKLLRQLVFLYFGINVDVNLMLRNNIENLPFEKTYRYVIT